MTLKFTPRAAGPLAALIKSNPRAPNPTGKPRILDATNPETAPAVATIVAQTDAKIDATDAYIESQAVPDHQIEDNLSGDLKLSKLVDDDFPFDESQLAAVTGIIQEQYAALTGPAGTGKTTVTKKIVDMLKTGVSTLSLDSYWKKTATEAANPDDPEDEYEAPKEGTKIPSIALCAFTGRAGQMIAMNFPVDWHSNIMTIHRLLGFYPEFYEDFNPETGNMVNTMRFVPYYTKDNKLPWDIIVVDEAGMCGLDLWHMLWDAVKVTTRIILIGDINQLPPTHGKSIFGFAMSEWPTWELTHIHRQKGANNSIVDNAHRVLKGQRPVSDSPKPLALKTVADAKEALGFMLKDPDWRFLTVAIDEGSTKAGAFIRESLKILKGANFYDPNRDAVITAINGYDTGQTGYGLGQDTMNRELAMILNPDSPRYMIDAGRERRNFAVGDKVMATKNDWEAGITNGMDGIITSIADHGEYAGDRRAFGRSEDVQAYLDSVDESEADEGHGMSLEDFNLESIEIGQKQEREKQGRGPASHILTIKFGEGESAIEMVFRTQAEVASIQLSYVKTCHKMQGGEAPLVFVILHQSHRRMLNREWFYTALTRASNRVVILYTRDGMGAALSKQTIKGRTLADKVRSFQKLQEIGIAGASVNVRMPRKKALSTDMVQQQPILDSEPQTAPQASQTVVVNIRNATINIIKESTNEPKQESDTIDGGEIAPVEEHAPSEQRRPTFGSRAAQLERPYRSAKRASTLGAIRVMQAHADAIASRLLTDQRVIDWQQVINHKPEPKPSPPVKPKVKVTLAALIAGAK